MTENNFEKLVHSKLLEKGLTKKQVSEVCEAYELAFKETLEAKTPVQIRGVFKTGFKVTKPKILRNAATGQPILDEQGNQQFTRVRTVVVFKASKTLIVKD